MNETTTGRFADAESLSEAAEKLAKKCKIMRAIHRCIGVPPLRDYEPGFEGLARIITGQQLSAASAAAIWTRVYAALEPLTPERVLALADAELAKHGLSSAKVRTLKALAAAITAGDLNLRQLHRASDEDLHASLCRVHGIGPWTADIYLLFALRRSDAFPTGDLALQIAVQERLQLAARPTPNELRAIAERWRPWRGAAAHLLWADYTNIVANRRKSSIVAAQKIGRLRHGKTSKFRG